MRNRRRITRGICRFCGKDYTFAYMGRHLSECASNRAGAADEKVVLLSVHSVGDHWLFVEMDVLSTLYDLDMFLRKVWLECCAHLSSFSWAEGGASIFPMDTPIALALERYDGLYHTYDMGEPTYAYVRAVALRAGPLRQEDTQEDEGTDVVALRARNDGYQAVNSPRYGQCVYDGTDGPNADAPLEYLKGGMEEFSAFNHLIHGKCCGCRCGAWRECSVTCRSCERECLCRQGQGSQVEASGFFDPDAPTREIERAGDIELEKIPEERWR